MSTQSVEPKTAVSGSFVASEVEGLKVCVAQTPQCTYTDQKGKFKVITTSENPLLYFYAGGVKVGEYRIKENGEIITPFKLTSTSKAGAVLAKTIHAIAGDTTGTAPKISLSGIQVETKPEVESLAEAVEDGVSLTLNVAKKDGESYQVKVEPQSQEVELCTKEGCREVNYREWLVLIYMDGDNSLSEYVDKDISELAQVKYSPMVKVVAMADYYGNDGGVVIESSDETGKLVKREIPEPDMGAQSTLEGFIKRNMDRYPALKTALILWNHGDGWRSSRFATYDQSQASYLFMYRLTDGLRELQSEGYSVNLIGFDECLMGMAEVFYDVGVFADAVVASELYEPGRGWNYAEIMEKLNREPYLNAYQLGKVIVDAYRNNYREDEDITMTMTVLSREEIEKLVGGINQLAGELSEESFSQFKAAREKAVEVPDTNYIDLYSFVKELPFSSARGIEEVIENAYSFSSAEEFKGISIYFPKSKEDDPTYPCYLKERPGGELLCFNDPNYYNPFAVNRWDEFLESYYSMEE